MSRHRDVVLIRGDALNPFEMQAYEYVARHRAVLAVGRRGGTYDTSAIRIPVRLLPGLGRYRLGRAVARRVPVRYPLLDADRLWGLRRVVGDNTIVHAAEVSLGFSDQAAHLLGDDARLVLTCWETIPFRHDTGLALAERGRRLTGRADRFVAVTGRARDALTAAGVSSERIRVIPAAVDTSRFHPDGRAPAALRRSWGAQPGDAVVLYVGRLIPEKGVLQLLRAFASGAPRSARLVFVGAGPEVFRVRATARRLGVDDRVVISGFAKYEDLPNIYRAADLVVVPSLTTPYWEEQFGMVLVEAMASGRALVATSSGAIPEVVGDAALLVEPYDVQELSAALSHVLTDEHARVQLGVRGRARSLERYAIEVVGPMLEAMYAEID